MNTGTLYYPIGFSMEICTVFVVFTAIMATASSKPGITSLLPV